MSQAAGPADARAEALRGLIVEGLADLGLAIIDGSLWFRRWD